MKQSDGCNMTLKVTKMEMGRRTWSEEQTTNEQERWWKR